MERHVRRTLALFAAATAALAAAGALHAPSPPTTTGLYEDVKKHHGRIDSYVARLRRHETVNGKRRPEELVLLKIREKPWSVYAKWLGEEGRGREGVYVKGQHGDKIHVRLAAGDVPFMPAGRRMALAPDGALMRAASTHPITELGVGAAVAKVGAVLAAQERGDKRAGELEAVGPQWRDEFGGRAYGIEHKIPAGTDRAVPSGGRRTYWIDPGTGLPTLVVTQDGEGREVEYYLYDRLQLHANLDDEDFDPDLLLGKPGAAKGGKR
jgi:hypothetical protein